MENAQYIYMGSLPSTSAVPSIAPVMPSKPPPPAEKKAEAPFDNPRADLILRSSDEVHFRVMKGILSIASPVFDDMFNIPSPPSEKQRDEIQVVPLSEDSTALDVALRHIYPVRTPNGDKLLYASILAEFARKYQVEALDEIIAFYLKDNIERDPVGVYAIAAANEHSIGATAAQSCLSIPFSGLRSPYLRCATAELELLKYHVACGEAASAVASSDRTWFSSLTKNGIFTRQVASTSGPFGAGSAGAFGSPSCKCTMLDFIPHNSTSVAHGGP